MRVKKNGVIYIYLIIYLKVLYGLVLAVIFAELVSKHTFLRPTARRYQPSCLHSRARGHTFAGGVCSEDPVQGGRL